MPVFSVAPTLSTLQLRFLPQLGHRKWVQGTLRLMRRSRLLQALPNRHIAAQFGCLAPSRRANAALRSLTSADASIAGSGCRNQPDSHRLRRTEWRISRDDCDQRWSHCANSGPARERSDRLICDTTDAAEEKAMASRSAPCVLRHGRQSHQSRSSQPQGLAGVPSGSRPKR